jgi:peptidoglycan/LPS O-acetylase OafA/YrhL
MTYTPLHLFWDGSEAVYLFFVLSGYVLVLPIIRKGRSRAGWVAYYPARLLRLYLPVAAAVGFAFLQFLLIPRRTVANGSLWLNAHDQPLSTRQLLGDVVLIRGTDWLNSALWSLRWEVIFSVLLPLVILTVFIGRRWWWAKLAVLFGLMLVGLQTEHLALFYLPMFGVGALLARGHSGLHRLALRLHTRSWSLLTIASLLLLNSYWNLLALGQSQAYANLLGRPLAVLGASLAIFVVSEWSSVRIRAEKPVPQWLGQRSFSLYLVHEPIVVSVALLLGVTSNPLPVLIVAVPISLVVAEVFYRVVEKPSHALARNAGRLTVRRLR